MQVRQLRSDFGQIQFTGRNLVAGSAAEFLEALGPLTLLGGALIVRHLDDYGHRRQHRYASFKALGTFLALGGEAELAVVTHSVTILAAVRVEHILGKLLPAFVGCDHPIQFCVLAWLGERGHGGNEQTNRDALHI